MAPSDERVLAFWCRTPSRVNFGDALTPWLLRRMTGRPPEFVHPDDRRHKYFVVGSVVRDVEGDATVWGAGILHRDDRVSDRATYRAVRGPLTRARLVACGARCPEHFGDPAVLLPRYHRPAAAAEPGTVGVVAHFSDFPRLSATFPRRHDELRLIDVQSGVERVADAIASCEVVASSSLHGLVVSHAYGIPGSWVRFGDGARDDDVKFEDYFLSVGMTPPRPVRVEWDHLDPRRLRDVAVLPTGIDVEPLLSSCPFPAS